jgi:hypothetical protein
MHHLEWIEFTPHEYGSAKYGVFGGLSDFGGKYYKGHLVKEYPESPLHYLQGTLNFQTSVTVLYCFNTMYVFEFARHMGKCFYHYFG